MKGNGVVTITPVTQTELKAPKTRSVSILVVKTEGRRIRIVWMHTLSVGRLAGIGAWDCEKGQFIISLCSLTPPPAWCPLSDTVPCKTELLNPAVPLSTLPPLPAVIVKLIGRSPKHSTLWSRLDLHHIPTPLQG